MRNENLIPLRKMDLELGKPLRWSVYDANGMLLLARGVVLDSENKIEVLIKKGLFRNPRREKSNAKGSLESEQENEDPGRSSHYRHDRDAGKVIHPIAKLPIGIAVSLQANADEQSDRSGCRYIGHLEGKSLLVTQPVLAGRLLPCHDGQNFFVRCFNGKTALAFKASILKSFLVPFPYLHLSFPKEVMVMKVREALRADVDLIATVDIGGVNAAVRILDLGVGGAFIHSGKPLGEKGETGDISFRIKFEDIESYIVAGIVIRSREVLTNDGKTQYGYGVQFRALSKEDKAMIMNLVYRTRIDLHS